MLSSTVLFSVKRVNYYRPFPNSLILLLKLTSSQKIALGLIYYGFQSLGSIPCNNILSFDFSAFLLWKKKKKIMVIDFFFFFLNFKNCGHRINQFRLEGFHINKCLKHVKIVHHASKAQKLKAVNELGLIGFGLNPHSIDLIEWSSPQSVVDRKDD